MGLETITEAALALNNLIHGGGDGNISTNHQPAHYRHMAVRPSFKNVLGLGMINTPEFAITLDPLDNGSRVVIEDKRHWRTVVAETTDFTPNCQRAFKAGFRFPGSSVFKNRMIGVTLGRRRIELAFSPTENGNFLGSFRFLLTSVDGKARKETNQSLLIKREEVSTLTKVVKQGEILDARNEIVVNVAENTDPLQIQFMRYGDNIKLFEPAPTICTN